MIEIYYVPECDKIMEYRRYVDSRRILSGPDLDVEDYQTFHQSRHKILLEVVVDKPSDVPEKKFSFFDRLKRGLKLWN